MNNQNFPGRSRERSLKMEWLWPFTAIHKEQINWKHIQTFILDLLFFLD